VLQRAHLPAFHSHFLTAHNTQFHCSPSCFSVLTCLHSIAIFSLHTIQALCFSIFSLNHIFFCLSHHGTFSRAKFPDPDDDGFKLFPCPSCLTQHLQLHANPRDWKDDSTALLMDLFEEKFLANSMNSLTQQQWQEILLGIEEAFPLTSPRTWAQVQSKVHEMRKKFNQLKQEHEESGAGQCKWPWFERCLLIWGKTAKAYGTCWRHGQWCSN